MTARSKNVPSIEYLMECFDLLENGKLIWRNRPSEHFSSTGSARRVNNAHAGTLAGIIGKDGYTIIRVANRLITAHSIVWAMTQGKWPDEEIDHIDRDRNNNRISNLREATREQNMANRIADRDNKTGHRGVCEHVPGKFRARITMCGKPVHLGVYGDAISAAKAYREAAIALRGEFAP